MPNFMFYTHVNIIKENTLKPWGGGLSDEQVPQIRGSESHTLSKFRQRRVSNFKVNYLILPLMLREEHPPPDYVSLFRFLWLFKPRRVYAGPSPS